MVFLQSSTISILFPPPNPHRSFSCRQVWQHANNSKYRAATRLPIHHYKRSKPQKERNPTKERMKRNSPPWHRRNLSIHHQKSPTHPRFRIGSFQKVPITQNKTRDKLQKKMKKKKTGSEKLAKKKGVDSNPRIPFPFKFDANSCVKFWKKLTM